MAGARRARAGGIALGRGSPAGGTAGAAAAAQPAEMAAAGAMEVDEEENPEAPLARACAAGDLPAAAAVLRTGAALEARDGERRTPLLVACLAGHLDLARLLLEAAADAEALDADGRGAALLAAEGGSVEVLQWLLGRGLATLTECAEDGSTPLLCAASGGSVAMVSWLLDGPAGALAAPSLSERDERGADAALVAAESGALECLGELLRRGAPRDTRDAHGCGLLHFAAAGGHVAVAAFCVTTLGIACDARDGDGDTPLLVAAFEGSAEVVEWLLASGSSLEERNDDGMSVLMAAAAGERSEVLGLLARLGGEAAERLVLEDVARHPRFVLNFLEGGAG